MKKVFRESALDKISSVDQLDKMLKVTSPMSWLALLGVTLVLVLTIIWSFTGELPYYVKSDKGVIISSDIPTITIVANQRGTVQTVIGSGREVYADDEVIHIMTADGLQKLTAGQVGTVSQVLVRPGEQVENEQAILRLIPRMSEGQKRMAVCYVPKDEKGKIKLGNEVHLTLKSDNDSYMIGRVVNIDSSYSSQESVEAVFGKGNGMYNTLTKDGQVAAIACELKPSTESKSGYKWSNDKGNKKELTSNSECNVTIITETEPPIVKLFNKLKDIWENR